MRSSGWCSDGCSSDLQFTASPANRVGLADITYIPTGEGWLYLAAVLDLATRTIVGWSMRDHMRTELTSGALMIGRKSVVEGKGVSVRVGRGGHVSLKKTKVIKKTITGA